MAVNADPLLNCGELLAWLNDTLQTSFTEVEQVCSGAAYCQLMDRLFPGSLDLSSVQFQSCSAEHSLHNLTLLEAAFKRAGVVRLIPTAALMKRSFVAALSFLQWFKLFFDENNNGREYHAFEARGGRSLVPADSDGRSSLLPDQDIEIIELRLGEPTEEPKETSDVILLISDDETEEVDVVDVKMETTAEDERLPEVERVVGTEPTENKTKSPTSDDNLVHLIGRHCRDNVNPAHLEDIVQACTKAPYGLYLYVGVELGGGRSTSVILIGYLDQSSGASVVRPLHALQMSADADDVGCTLRTEESDAGRLIQVLRKFCLPLANVAAFYCDAPQPALRQAFLSRLLAFNPRLISLCELRGVAGRACQAGLVASFSPVVKLVREVHHCISSGEDSLKEVFTDSCDPSLPVSTQCLFVVGAVQKMVARWRDLLEYFKPLRDLKEAEWIRTQMMDPQVKLHFLFLSHALEPLRGLAELQRRGPADTFATLQMTSELVQSYAASVLRPSVAERFVRRRDLHLLYSQRAFLPPTEVDVGSRARDFLWATPVVDLQEHARSHFHKVAKTFYKAVLQSLGESLPEQLGDTALRNIGAVLKHPEKTSLSVLSTLAVQLGLCPARSLDTRQLSHDFLHFIQAVKEEQMRRNGEDYCWTKMLCRLKPHTTLQRVLLTLLALPTSLHRTQVFTKVLKSITVLRDIEDPPDASPRPGRWLQRPGGCRSKRGKHGGESSSEDSSMEESADDTDNSSDVVDVTEESKMSHRSRLLKTQSERALQAESVFIVSSDKEDDGMDSTATLPSSAGSLDNSVGELVWGQMKGFSTWPAVVIHDMDLNQAAGRRMVKWYGQEMSSQVSLQVLTPFAAFTRYFCANSFAVLITYREAVFLVLQEAALRCQKQFAAGPEDRDELLKQMLDWAFGGFQPSGPDGLKPAASVNAVSNTTQSPRMKMKMKRKKLFPKASSSPDSSGPMTVNKAGFSSRMREVSVCLNKLSCSSSDKTWRSIWEEGGADSSGKGSKGATMKEKGGGGGWGRGKAKGGKRHKKTYSLFYGSDADVSPNYVPYKKRNLTKTNNKVNQQSSVYTQPDQKIREETIRRIMDMKLDIEGFCLCCGTEVVEVFHPLFRGSLCLKCKNNFTETLYRYDEDGYQSYCTVCCYGMEVLLCGNNSCCRSFCRDCLNILVGPGTFDSLKQLDPWICYLCQPHRPHAALVPRPDWSIRVQELFANHSAMEFEPHRVYPSIPASLRRPLRVLSLFDGIATGYLVLKELGFKVEKYVASEICEDSIAVATVNHDGKIVHVGDVCVIAQEHINQWGPFDLLIGGSPCNDLSIVNPIRKGLYGGTGRLFFEYYRILELLKPKEEDPRPFFWLFENVVFMNTHDKVNICRFLECNPVMVDAIKVSPAHRARYFWGNIPGMSRPIIASQTDKLNLQDCLEIGREARMTKVRTITTNPNSLKQGKDVSLLPVLQSGREDNLWITELEKIFGFPKHYTDVRNMNRQQRQKVLGKAWSVPVIRHLFAPLKDYFACEELPPMTSNSSTSPPPTASPRLPGPAAVQIREAGFVLYL
ncbi:uncharacterized protein [Embiotoca jacksoni]|uniref:uncharacterized protein n=1 Tax=Embiotoca jacksoni TaxID=100190 RepID=UPI003703A46D